jgi:7-carboxy-7-deazaguanine synthase
MSRLRISEIFYSLQGEGRYQGLPTVFIRLTGCPLRCAYCDTEYAFSGGEWMEIPRILQRVAEYTPGYVCVTGGEPLAQTACQELLTRLCEEGYSVSLETSGALDISMVDKRVCRVMDIKTPDSGEADRNLMENVQRLNSSDQVKFVICSESDYLWSRRKLEELGLADKCEVLFSPAYGRQPAETLADWIVRDRLPVRFQVQLHKALWGEQSGR